MFSGKEGIMDRKDIIIMSPEELRRVRRNKSIHRRIKTVVVEDRLDGSMHVRNNGTYFKYREIGPKLIRRPEVSKKVTDRPRKVYIPPKDHAWRKFKLKGSLGRV